MFIDGIYGWGKGITKENSDHFNDVIKDFCESYEINYTINYYDVVTVKNEDLKIYFHPMQIVIESNNDNAELSIGLTNFLNNSSLPIKIKNKKIS
jgi:hypothetical protein